MKTINAIVIQAPLKKVYEAAAAIEHWPAFLPHYRWVTIFEDAGGRRDVEMAAFRDGFPCQWRSDQVFYPRQNKIYFKHTQSTWSQNMEVWWILKALKNGATEVSITHDMPPAPNAFAAWFRQHVVGEFFVMDIADKTLRHLKLHLERS